MHKLHRQTTQFLGFGLVLIFCAGAMPAQQIAGSLSGRVTDQMGGAIAGAALLMIRGDGAEKRSVTNGQGVYLLDGLAPGAYRLRLEGTGFAPYENDQLNVEAGRRHTLDITLQATIEKQKVTVSSGDSRPSTDPDRNTSAVVLKGADLDALPDDPAALEATLRALAGPSAGPSGGQLYIDGFTATSAPQKSTIREIQINQNPFSAENERLGFGRIEIFTKPGSGAFHGGAFGIFNDEVLNSRDPYAANRPAFQTRAYGGSLSGPVVTKRASFFASVFRREIDDNAVINATVLDPGFKIVTLSEALTTPKRFFDLTPRFDYQVNKNNTLWARYSFSGADYEKAGIGQFSLPSRAFDSSVDEHTIQVADTAVISKSAINEARFQYSYNRKEQRGDNLMPEVAVLEAFTGGGSQTGRSATSSNRWEAQNYTTLSLGRQTVKFGVRLRGIELTDISSSNFGGTFTFTGGRGPALDERDQMIRDSAGHPVIEEITSIERYRRTLLFAGKGLSPSEIRAVGGGASLLTLASGNPRASIDRIDGGVFAQDDWRLDPFLTLSFGFRYEAQSNIHNNMNFAPRAAFAWSPRASFARPAKRVIRGGFGIFYDRVPESLTLQALRYSGENQQQFVVSAPGVLDLFPRVPSADEMAAFSVPQSVWRVAAGLRSPYTIQSSLSLEQQLPLRTTLTVSFINSRGLHYLRARNVNAPLPGAFDPASPSGGVRPLGLDGNVFEYESSGVLKQDLLVWNVTNRLNRRLTLFGVYIFSKTSSDTDGAGNFPASSFDLSGEFGRSSLDARHRVFVGGTVNLPGDVALNPLVLLSSGLPFNITTGTDSNGDSIFAERPALSPNTAEPGVRVTPFGAFTLNPGPGQSMIPRNFGSGPGVLLINLRLGKTIGFGHAARPSTSGNPPKTGTPARTPASEKPVKLTFAILGTNILNHVNRGVPIGNLSSPLFGQSNSVAGAGLNSPIGSGGNRRLDLQVNLAF